MKKTFKIVMIGVGNLSHHLLQSFFVQRNIEIVQIFNHRKTLVAKKLSSFYKCELVSAYSDIDTTADIYFICVKDEAINGVIKCLAPLKLRGIVVHTSGSTDVSVLKKSSLHCGVFYPLQSFSVNESVDWKSTPLLIEANNNKTLIQLKLIANQLSNSVKVVDSKKRMQFHLAAVFANNFTNALYLVAFQLIENSLTKKDTKLLEPLIIQSFHKMLKLLPLNAQTGPAKRNDQLIMNKHLSLLSEQKNLKKIYKQLSALIIDQQKTNT